MHPRAGRTCGTRVFRSGKREREREIARSCRVSRGRRTSANENVLSPVDGTGSNGAPRPCAVGVDVAVAANADADAAAAVGLIAQAAALTSWQRVCRRVCAPDARLRRARAMCRAWDRGCGAGGKRGMRAYVEFVLAVIRAIFLPS